MYVQYISVLVGWHWKILISSQKRIFKINCLFFVFFDFFIKICDKNLAVWSLISQIAFLKHKQKIYGVNFQSNKNKILARKLRRYKVALI